MDALIFIAIMFGAIYLLMFRPQQKQRQAQEALHRSLKEGDVVMTNSGIYGAIAEVEDDVVWLEVAPEVELKVMKSMIADRAPEDSDDEVDDDADEAELAEQGDEG